MTETAPCDLVKTDIKFENIGDRTRLDTDRIRADFPILKRMIDGRPLIYMDSAATSLKPRPVIEAIVRFYTESCANIHRGVHLLSDGGF